MGEQASKLPMLIAFVLGALCALLPMYFFYGTSGTKDRSSRNTTAADQAQTLGEAARPPAIGSPRFASRLTYELSQVPEYRASPFADTVSTASDAAASTDQPPAATAVPPPTTTRAAEAPSAGERVANARPITTAPPQPSERAQEAQKKEAPGGRSHEPAGDSKTPAPPSSARVIEGRDVELKPKLPDTPTRPIGVNPAADTRAEIEAERKRRALESPKQPRQLPDSKAAEPPVPGGSTAPAPGTTSVKRSAASASSAPGPASQTTAPVPAASGATRTETGSAASDATADSIQRRLESTREWLASASSTTYTIQLMDAGEDQLRSELKSLSKVLDPARLYIFRTMAQGRPSITVAYGAYPDRQSAVEALEKLPASVVANRPVLRTVNGIRAELKQHGFKARPNEQRRVATKPGGDEPTK